jgi:6-phosphogluconolactonase
MPWDKTHLFWVDERCVTGDSPLSNYGSARKDFIDAVSIPEAQIHPMPGGDPPNRGAYRYQSELMISFHLKEGEFPLFDLIFLGVGSDGHTGSLFPGQNALNETRRAVVSVKGGDPDIARVTLTYPVLNRSGRTVFLVSGRKKASVLKGILDRDDRELPARKIRPVNGHLTWLLDREAASLLERVK